MAQMFQLVNFHSSLTFIFVNIKKKFNLHYVFTQERVIVE